MKKVLVLGATGSIGRSTIEVIRNMREEFYAVALVAAKNKEALTSLSKEIDAPFLLTSEASEEEVKDFIVNSGADIAVNGIAGAGGLEFSLYVLEAGMDLALANKESVVMAWHLLKEAADKNKARIIPVDSEHAALFHLINYIKSKNIKELVITASGGPFRTASKEELERVEVADALNHPTWRMGKKITIDSATLANKGLEVIEASRLFFMSVKDIKVVVHPESIVHSFVKTLDGMMYGEFYEPDMKRAIYSALSYPEVKPCYMSDFDLFDKNLSFFRPRLNDFPMLEYGYEVAEKNGAYTIAYNAANEVAVEAFMKGEIGFTTISRVVRGTIDKNWGETVRDYKDVMDADEAARSAARAFL